MGSKKSSDMIDQYVCQDIVFLQKKRYKMARTKQTARCAVQAVYKSRPPTFNARGKGRSRGAGRSNSPDSSSEESIDAAHQQFSLKFDNQPQCQKKSITQPTFECTKCKAFLNSFSLLQKPQKQIISQKSRASRSKKLSDAEKQLLKASNYSIWVCEFCHNRNQVPESIPVPKEQNACYLLKGPTKSQNKVQKNVGQKVLIYCIDKSGSMDTVCQGKGRLEAVRQAIRDEIKRVKFQGQKIKIGIVLFGSQVVVQQKQKGILVSPNTYMNFDLVVSFADTVKEFAYPVQTHFNQLEKIIKEMSTFGSTALGPGLLTSIQLAGRKRGSKVVLCTDGQANVGLLGPQFYTKAAGYAKEKGVMVNILSLKGDNCNLKQLGKIALSTGGSIMKIDPKLLGSQFNKISKEQIFGTDSNLRIVVNHFFEIQNATHNQISADKTILTQDFGNFTADTELTFNFKILSNEEAQKKGVNMDIIKQKRLPMQVQLTYTNEEGARYLQVVNDHRELTLNANDVFNNTDFPLFSTSSLQKISKLIKDEKFSEAEAQIRRFNSLLKEVFSKKQKAELIAKYSQRMNALGKVLKSKQSKKSGKSMKKKSTAAKPKKIAASTKIKKARGKGKRPLSDQDQQESQQQSSQCMQSDFQEQIICKQMRARS